MHILKEQSKIRTNVYTTNNTLIVYKYIGMYNHYSKDNIENTRWSRQWSVLKIWDRGVVSVQYGFDFEGLQQLINVAHGHFVVFT